MKTTLRDIEPLIITTMKAGLVPMIHAEPGVGKSDMVRSVGKKYNLKVIDMRLAQFDPTDLNGFPSLDKEKGRSYYAPPMNIPLEGDELPEGYDGWLLFLDEITSAAPSVQAAAYKVILDRMIGDRHIHKHVGIIAAGNLITDKAVVFRMSTALQSRLVHYEVEIDHEGWYEWANKNDIDFRIVGFLRYRAELLHKFNPKHNDHTYPCPRTWEFVSKQIKDIPNLSHAYLPLLCGTVGDGAASEFFAFTEVFSTLPTREQLLLSPESCVVPQEPGSQYAVSSLLSHMATADNIDKLIIYIHRIPIEFQVITIQNFINSTDRNMVNTPAIKEWIRINAATHL